MAKKSSKSKSPKPRKSKERIEYEHQLYLLKRRISTWKKKKHAIYTDIPQKGKKSYAKATEELKKKTWNKLSEEEKQQAYEEYQYQYEKGNIEIPEAKIQPYVPHTETDFLESNDDIDNFGWEGIDEEPIDIKEKIDEAIEDIINSILDDSNITRANEDVRAVLEKLLYDLRFSLGDKDFYEYMSDGDRVDRLREIAQEGMYTSPPKDGMNGADTAKAHNLINAFVTELNFGKPLSNEQSQNLSQIIETAGFLGGVNYDIDTYFNNL